MFYRIKCKRFSFTTSTVEIAVMKSKRQNHREKKDAISKPLNVFSVELLVDEHPQAIVVSFLTGNVVRLQRMH